MATNDADGYLVSRGYAFYVFGLLCLLYMFDYIDRMVIVSLFPYLKQDWGLSDTHCGLLISAVYWSIVVISFPISVIIDRWSRKKCIAWMAVIWSIATAACAFTRSFGQLFTARVVIGVGEAGYAPGGTAMISALFPQRMRAMMVGLWSAFIPLGSAIGILAGGYIAATFGWRHAFGIVALPGFIVAVLFFFVRDYRTVGLEKAVQASTADHPKRPMGRKEIVREFTHTPSLLLTYIGFAGSMFVAAAYISWLPTYFHRVYGLPMEKAAARGSLVMLLAVVGSPMGGILADRWMKRRPNARPLFSSLSALCTAVLFFVSFQLLSGTNQYLLLLIGGMSASMFASAAITITQDVVHPGLRATSYSFCVIFQNLLGSSVGPLFVGIISDRYGIETAMSLVPFAALFASALFFLASLFYKKDLAKAEKIALTIET